LLTFQSIVGSFSRAYVNPDEAMRDSIENAHLMEKDVGLLESVECRQRLTALLDWEIKPEDEKCQYQVSLAQELQRIISRIRNFTKYRMWLMKAIWSGRSGIQHKYGYTRVNGAMRMMPTPLHRDHNGWMPINGDKLVFRYEDGWMDSDDGAYPHQMGIRVGTNPGKGKMRIHRDYKLEPVSDGLALFLKPYERDTFCVHKHFIEDADFHHSYFAGSVHGIGIRSKIYWEWFLKQEAFAFLMQYLERSAGGIEVWTYPMGDPKALAATQAAAKEKMANGRNIVFFPKPMGDDSESYKFEVIEPGAMGLDIMQNIIENYFGGRLKRYILGQELSTEAKATGMGSGVAEAHMDTLSQIVQFDASNLEETLTHELVRYIQQLNFPETMGWHMRMSLKTKDDKTQERLEALNAAYQMGASIAESEVFKTLGLSAPTSGEKVLSLSSQQAAAMPPGMPGMPPMGGIPDGDNSGQGMPQDGGDFPDGENEDDGEQDPVDLIRSLMEQYAQQIERERYGTQGMFKWEESLHPRETSTDMVHKAGQFTSKKTAPQQKSLFEGVTPQARQSSRFSGKTRSGRKALNDRIRSLFAEHAASRQKQLRFDDPVEIPAQVPEPKPVSHRETESPKAENIEKTPVQAPEPAPAPAPPKRRMMGASPDSMKAVAQPVAPPIQPKPQPQQKEVATPQATPQKQADPPSVETVPQPTNQPAVAAQPVNTSEQVPTSSNTEHASGDVSKRNQLVTDNFHLVAQTVRMMQKQGWATRDSDAAESAAMDGLMKAAEKWDGSTDFATYAKNGMAQAIKNLNRRKMDKITSNQSGDDETDPLANVAGRSSEPDYGDDEREKLNNALSSLGNEQDQWLVRAWFSGEDEDGNTINQSQAAESYNSKFGQKLTRQAIGYRATQLLKKLQSQLAGDSEKYAAVRNMVIRYYRREMLELQKERYERRQDRTIREAAEYTESDPTDAQIKAGNYKKGRFSWNGMQIVIENPRGSVRRGVASNGEIWKRDMTAHYGYISGTKGTDGDQVDVFMGRNPESEVVFVICQTNKDGSFDEHKAILGTTNERKARDLYLSHYPKGWKCGKVVAMTVAQFKEWLNSGECCHE
jgi:RNA polymerase sigma factor (sigma-70 family)